MKNTASVLFIAGYREGVVEVRLTFNDDYYLDDESYCPKGMRVNKANVHEGIEAKRWEQDFVPVVIDDETEWFLKSSFKEYEDD